MNIRFIISTILMTIITAMMLSACERHGAISDLQEYLKKVKDTEAQKKRISIIAELKPPLATTYQVEGGRSPFSAVAIGNTEAIAANPLLAYPLTVLRFVGTLTQGSMTFAFIMTPDNMVYQVKEGDVIGDHQGKVVSILPNRLNVMEQESEKGTTVMQRIVTLELKEGL